MMNTVAYFFMSGLSSLVFYAVYALWLKNDRYFEILRFYLLFAVVFSLVLPFLHIPFFISDIQTAPGDGFRIVLLPEILISEGPYGKFSLLSFLISTFYWGGVILFSIFFLVKILRIVLIIVGSPKIKMEGFLLIISSRTQVPFSFLHFVILPENVANNREMQTIMAHEKIHVSKKHTLDLLFMEVVRIFHWFNPVFLFFEKSLKNLHEYSVDKAILREGTEKKYYFSLIFKQISGYDINGITNNFNQVLTKKRIKMMMHQQQSKWVSLKLLTAIPLTVALLFVNTLTAQNDPGNNRNRKEISADQNEKEKSADIQTLSGKTDAGNQFPEYGKGSDKFIEYLGKNLVYPQSAIDKEVQGRVYVGFNVDKQGSLKNVRIIRSDLEAPTTGEEVEKAKKECEEVAVRVVKNSGKWKPALQDGKPVEFSFMIPIRFDLQDKAK